MGISIRKDDAETSHVIENGEWILYIDNDGNLKKIHFERVLHCADQSVFRPWASRKELGDLQTEIKELRLKLLEMNNELLALQKKDLKRELQKEANHDAPTGVLESDKLRGHGEVAYMES